jgi:hypothetical protein
MDWLKWQYTFDYDTPEAPGPSLHTWLWHFRICRNNENRDCSTQGVLRRNDTFLLHDEIGHRNFPFTGKVNFVTGAGHHFQQLPFQPPNAAIQPPTPFKLLPMCVGKHCGFCLRSADMKYPGLAETGPLWNDRGIALVENERYCIPVMFEKVACLEEERSENRCYPFGLGMIR